MVEVCLLAKAPRNTLLLAGVLNQLDVLVVHVSGFFQNWPAHVLFNLEHSVHGLRVERADPEPVKVGGHASTKLLAHRLIVKVASLEFLKELLLDRSKSLAYLFLTFVRDLESHLFLKFWFGLILFLRELVLL